MSATHSPTLPVRWPVLAGLVAAGIVMGLGSAWALVKSEAAFVAVGPWRTSLLAGSVDAGLHVRARVAVLGLLALSRDETMYYVANTDGQGRPLRAVCSYRITGTPPKARWWSLTAYADDYFLFADAQRRYAINSMTARFDAEGRFSVVTGPFEPTDTAIAWLPTPGDRGLVLTLRLYNPDPALQAAPASLVPPRIESSGDCA